MLTLIALRINRGYTISHTDQCLDHLHSLCPHILEVLEDTQSSLTPHLLHGQVQEDEGSSPPHPGTAVDQEGCGQRGGVLLADTTNERDEGQGVVRYSMVRPGTCGSLSALVLL